MNDDPVREIGGELVSSFVATSEAVQVEVLRRRAGPSLDWTFRQPRAALLWLRAGVSRLDISVGGAGIQVPHSPKTDLALIPATLLARGVFATCGGYSDYVMVFLDETTLAGNDSDCLHRPLLGFGDPLIRSGLARLASEATNPDRYFGMYAQGWALQTIARLGRLSDRRAVDEPYHGGLSAVNLRKVLDLVADSLSEGITVAALASACGLSPRHFARAFRESVGSSPARYITEARMQRAKTMLTAQRSDITAVAFACGFAHAQHFTTRFKKETGMTPSQYRRSTRS